MPTGSPMRYLTSLYGFLRRMSAESDIHAMFFGINLMAVIAGIDRMEDWKMAIFLIGTIGGASAWCQTRRAAKAKP